MRSSTTVDATGSRPAVGSSNMTTSSTSTAAADASVVMARARATRFFIPPESSEGYRSSMPNNPTFARFSETRFLISGSLSDECSYSLKPTFSLTVSESKSAPFWKTSPSCTKLSLKPDSPCAASASSSSDPAPPTSRPSTKMLPLSGAMSPVMSRRTVDLPVPDGPMMPTASPRLMVKETPFRTCLLPKAFHTSRNSMMVSPFRPRRRLRGGIFWDGGTPSEDPTGLPLESPQARI
mmetsp:Transcript_1638/g.3606  ORF Transcript_1638/g.3606 Transcript_1638/m.3606 type:complete len:237 (-) Transcript_1638:364-1074(-)